MPKVYNRDRIALDGQQFIGDRFELCELVYSGGEPPTMVNCTFHRVEWIFDGAASNTIAFLGALYSGMGQGGKDLVERTFDSIRLRQAKQR